VDIFSLSPSVRSLIAATMAGVPAIVAYVRGRGVLRFIDDPALPERLFAGRRVTSRSLIFTIGLLIVMTGSAAIWAIPLTLIAYLAGGWPARRILYEETWSLSVYLSFMIRFFVANWSFWLLVTGLPAIALSAGRRAWIVAAVMGPLLMLYAARQAEVIRWLIRARPIVDEAIRARFDRLVAACGIAAPRFEVIDPQGGRMANGFALPSLRQSSVLFTGPLIARLDADELDAICAHELAHIEYHTVRRMRRRRLVSRSLVAAGALLAPVLQLLSPAGAWMLTAVWPVVVLIAIASMARDRQKHETASDLRAIALTGNPEALVSALVKLHAIARVPRRWDADLERHQTHPSLKKRIQDIRGAAGTPPAALGETAVFVSADGASRAVFGADSLEWSEGTSASYRLGYDRLGELRVAATRAGETSLLAADRAGHRWRMALRIEDVPRLQAVLDIVDARVGTTAASGPVFQPIVVRAATLAVLVVSLNTGMIAAAIVLALTLVQPAAPLLAASGIAAIAGGVLTWRDAGDGFMPGEYQTIAAGVLIVAGTLLAWLAYARRREEIRPRAWQFVGVVAAAALASWIVPMMAGGHDAVSLHQVARAWPSSAALPLALAAAMLWTSRKALRVATAAVAVAASMTAAAAGSQAFLDRFGRDPFLAPAPELSVRTLDHPIKEFTIPFGMSGLEISPGGRSIVAVSRNTEYRAVIHIGRAGDSLTEIDGDGAIFVDDDHAVVWKTDGSRTELREVAVAAPGTPDWQLQVTGLTTAVLSVDPASKRWRLSGPGANVIEAREGVIGTPAIDRYRWPVHEGQMSAVTPIALAGDHAIAFEPRPDLSSITDPLGGLMLVLANGPHWRSTLWALGPDGAVDLGTSRLDLMCQRLPGTVGACQIFDSSRTRFLAVDAATRSFKAVASLRGRFMVGAEPNGAWLTGWYQSGMLAVRLAPLDAIRVTGPNDDRPQLLVVSDHAAAGVWYHYAPAAGMRVDGMRVDAMYGQTGTSLVRIYAID